MDESIEFLTSHIRVAPFSFKVGPVSLHLTVNNSRFDAFIWQRLPGHEVGLQVRCDDFRSAIVIVARLAAHQPYTKAIYRVDAKPRCDSLSASIESAWGAVIDCCMGTETVNAPIIAAFIASQRHYDATLRIRMRFWPAGGYGWKPVMVADARRLIAARQLQQEQEQEQSALARIVGALKTETAGLVARWLHRRSSLPMPVPMSVCVNPDGSGALVVGCP